MSHSLRPMNCSTPGFPILQYLPEVALIHVHCFSVIIQPSHPVTQRQHVLIQSEDAFIPGGYFLCYLSEIEKFRGMRLFYF